MTDALIGLAERVRHAAEGGAKLRIQIDTLENSEKNLAATTAGVGVAITEPVPNYVLQAPQGVTADIAPAVLTLAGLTVRAGGQTYDGTRTVALGGTPTTVVCGAT